MLGVVRAVAESEVGEALRRLCGPRARGSRVAVGPGGALVVQAKWGSDEAGVHDLAALATKLKSDAEDVRLMPKARPGNAPVRAVVVIWGRAAARMRRSPRARSVACRS